MVDVMPAPRVDRLRLDAALEPVLDDARRATWFLPWD